jgi:hypothetical protein
MSKTYELPEPRTTKVYDVWLVYKDYDANAPDTETLVWCATEELALMACEMLKKSEDNGDKVVVDGNTYELYRPYSDGHEWCSSYRCCQAIVTEAHSDEIACSLADVARLRQSD